jgi:carboxyl-terminal processing protease
MLLFYDAASKIEAISLDPVPLHEMVPKALRAYLKKTDPFSDYLTREEYAAFKVSSSDSRYAGVGMDIGEDRSGRIVCIPYSGSPAERGGVFYGDTLAAVDGRPVEGQSVFAVGRSIRGPVGTKTALTLRDPSGKTREVTVIRGPIRFQSVQLQSHPSLSVIRIMRFTPHTPQELRDVLPAVTRGKSPVVVDLRGNTGGDLFAAIDCSALFLDSGAKIVEVKTRKGAQWYSGKQLPVDRTSKLYLWQDGQTASAAEVFIAALVQNGRAVSIGQKSFGKGISQRFEELMDGSALLLTYASILPPNGVSFHGEGLEPGYATIPTPGSIQGDSAYRDATMRLINGGVR